MGKTSKIAATAAVAAGIGYVAGILTAPKSGKETRQDIQKKAMQAKKEISQRLHQMNDELTSLIQQAKSKVKELESSAKAELQKAVDTAVVAKDKARDIITGLQHGEVEDRDLKNAVKDVNKAIDNLKKYLNKNV